MTLNCLVAPVEQPVTLAALLSHLKRPAGDDDDQVQHCLDVAVAQFDGPDGELGRALVSQTWRETFRTVPPSGGAVELELSPVSEVVGVFVFTPASEWQAVPLEAVELIEDGGRFWVRADTWPQSLPGHSAPLRIEYVAGFGAAVDVPAPLCHAILLFAAHIYAVREPVVLDATPVPVPLSIDRLVSRYKVWWR